jgi:phenylalanine-4-hydroxylase
MNLIRGEKIFQHHAEKWQERKENPRCRVHDCQTCVTPGRIQMAKESSYVAKLPGPNGLYHYTAEEDAVWGELYERQMKLLTGMACKEYLDGVRTLGLGADKVPQLLDVDRRLHETTGFGVEGVPALIPPSRFYELLSQGKFPLATFLRRREHIDYIEEPDLFHEVFGHCPLLTNQSYANFVKRFGEAAVKLGKGFSWHLFRIFWFTVEFGLINTTEGRRCFGAGIVSSPSEAKAAMDGSSCEFRPFDLMTVLRTPYRIDIVQPIYYVIDSFAELEAIVDQDIGAMILKAKALGDYPPAFEAKAS